MTVNAALMACRPAAAACRSGRRNVLEFRMPRPVEIHTRWGLRLRESPRMAVLRMAISGGFSCHAGAGAPHIIWEPWIRPGPRARETVLCRLRLPIGKSSNPDRQGVAGARRATSTCARRAIPSSGQAYGSTRSSIV